MTPRPHINSDSDRTLRSRRRVLDAPRPRAQHTDRLKPSSRQNLLQQRPGSATKTTRFPARRHEESRPRPSIQDLAGEIRTERRGASPSSTRSWRRRRVQGRASKISPDDEDAVRGPRTRIGRGLISRKEIHTPPRSSLAFPYQREQIERIADAHGSVPEHFDRALE